jgi:endonuclease YncB( thermonuclease family)
MLGWRRRNDGFEWREYVRTTILVRRKNRRDRIKDAGIAAVGNIKAAGQRGAAAGAEGAKAVGRGAAQAGQQGAKLGAAGAKLGAAGAKIGAGGAKAFGAGAVRFAHRGAEFGAVGARAGAAKARASIPVIGTYLQRFGAAIIAAAAYTWAVLRTLAGIVGDYLGPPLAPLARFLRQRGIRLAVLLAGCVALLGGIIRARADGFVQDTWIVLLIGIVLLGALFLAHGPEALPERIRQPLHSAGATARGGLAALFARPSMHLALAGGAIVLLLLGGYALLPASGPTSTTSGSVRADRGSADAPETTTASIAGTLRGTARALSGDRLRVGKTVVSLSGIEAPELNQSCTNADGKSWNCGQSARQALARLVRGRRVNCEVSGGTGSCTVGETDIAAELVRRGHVFAESGFFSSYGGIEGEAQEARAGIWDGEPLRPADYRTQRWNEAQEAAPDGCPIKASVRRGRRYYLVPWADGYDRLRVVESRGGRWFCSEEEAKRAGFQPSGQS